MAMLTHDFEPPTRSSRKQLLAGAEAGKAHLAMLRRFCLCALTVLLAGRAVAAVIALKTAVYFARFHPGAG